MKFKRYFLMGLAHGSFIALVYIIHLELSTVLAAFVLWFYIQLHTEHYLN